MRVWWPWTQQQSPTKKKWWYKAVTGSICVVSNPEFAFLTTHSLPLGDPFTTFSYQIYDHTAYRALPVPTSIRFWSPVGIFSAWSTQAVRSLHLWQSIRNVLLMRVWWPWTRQQSSTKKKSWYKAVTGSICVVNNPEFAFLTTRSLPLSDPFTTFSYQIYDHAANHEQKRSDGRKQSLDLCCKPYGVCILSRSLQTKRSDGRKQSLDPHVL